jgi:nucleoside-diphosphate-sugar epimerase
MDRIWPQVKNTKLSFDSPPVRIRKAGKGEKPFVLVTGATGFLGSRLVEKLIGEGFDVRALVRRLSNIEKIRGMPVEIVYGDVGSAGSMAPAFDGIDMVVHAAADTAGREEESRTGTIEGTMNVLDLCRRHGVGRLVYISSCSVYGVADYAEGRTVDEGSPLERFPERRGVYSSAKLKAEELVRSAMKNGEVPAVCLRPGTIYGPGGELFTPMMGFSLGDSLYMVIGDGSFVLPLVYVDNLCDAVVAALKRDEGVGEVFNVVDNGNLTKRDYMELLIGKLHPGSRAFYLPLGLLYPVVQLQEWLTGRMGRPPFLTRYRLVSSQKKIVYDSSKIERVLGWKPPFSTRDGIDAVLAYELGKSVSS